MPNAERPSLSLMRQDLERDWRFRFVMARERYQTASRRYRKLLREKPEGLTPRHDDPVAIARHEESEALAEYTRILKLFTGLVLYGRIPEEQLAAQANGGRDWQTAH